MTNRKGWSALVTIGFVLVVGCGGDETSHGNSGSGGSGGGAAATSSSGGTSDAQYCAEACSTLIGCGVGLEQTSCQNGCLATAPFLACVKTSAKDCNSVALCSYVAGCGAGKTPSGTATCQQTQDCVGSACIGNPTPMCGCDCSSLMSPTYAINFYILTTCSSTLCNAECGPTGTASACTMCLMQNCPTQDAQCN